MPNTIGKIPHFLIWVWQIPNYSLLIQGFYGGEDYDKKSNVCGACRAVLAARLQYDLQGTCSVFDKKMWLNQEYLTVTSDKIYHKAMVLETTQPFFTPYLVASAIQDGVSGYYTKVDGVDPRTGKEALAAPIRRNSHASLMSSCKICKGERKAQSL